MYNIKYSAIISSIMNTLVPGFIFHAFLQSTSNPALKFYFGVLYTYHIIHNNLYPIVICTRIGKLRSLLFVPPT